jgi:CheY-like chemotaxis protein
MFRVLLVEDDSFKAKSIQDLLSIVRSDSQVVVASSLVEGIERLGDGPYDLAIVDMAIPSHPTVSGGGAPMSLLSGGLDILLEIDALGRGDLCVVVTQYPEIEIAGRFFPVDEASEQIRELLGCDVLECIEYSEGCDRWKQKLKGLLENYEDFGLRG